MGPRLLHPRTQTCGVRDRQDYPSSLRLQNQVGGSDLRKAQESTCEVWRTAPQVQRNRLSADSEPGHINDARVLRKTHKFEAQIFLGNSPR